MIIVMSYLIAVDALRIIMKPILIVCYVKMATMQNYKLENVVNALATVKHAYSSRQILKMVGNGKYALSINISIKTLNSMQSAWTTHFTKLFARIVFQTLFLVLTNAYKVVSRIVNIVHYFKANIYALYVHSISNKIPIVGSSKMVFVSNVQQIV